jgi:hypothetical protein
MRQHLFTRREFEAFIAAAQVKLFVRPPYRVVPCACGDVNCHGWRFIEVRGDAVRPSTDRDGELAP